MGENETLFFLLNGLPETNYFIKLLVWWLARKPTLPAFIIFFQIKKIPSESIKNTTLKSMNFQK